MIMKFGGKEATHQCMAAIELADFKKISRVTETKIILDEDGISKG